jgi:ubiquinone/menaquinone biosynthesis C-methylase UbiE
MARGAKRWLFDGWSLFYDVPSVQRTVYRPPQDAVVTALRETGCRRVLDVGCGTGQLAARLHRETPGMEIVGCDYSRGMLARARARDAGSIWIQGDGSRLPFRDASFDAIISTEAFHWLPDRSRALAEFRRVLRPRGRLLLALVNPRFPVVGRIVALVSRLVGQPFRWPTRGELRRLVQHAGFRVERQATIFRLPGALLAPAVLTVAARQGARRRPVRRRAGRG